MVGQIVLACDEAASNVFRHGYETRPGPIKFHAQTKDGSLIIEICDQAPRVTPEKIHGRDLDDLRPGGLGTVIMRKIFDSVEYLPRAVEGNCLRLIKRIPQS